MNAFKNVFPHAVLKGCHFRFTQAIWRNIQEQGLSAEYKANSNLRKWFGLFGSLAFVPMEQIVIAWEKILTTIPQLEYKVDIKIKKFINYFSKQWMQNSNIPINIWNHSNTVGPRKKNHVEGI